MISFAKRLRALISLAGLCLVAACGGVTPTESAAPIGSAVTIYNGPVSEIEEGWQYVWKVKLGMTTLLPRPSVQFHTQTSNDALLCPSASGAPKRGLVTNQGAGGNCATGWLPNAHTAVGIVLTTGQVPYQTDVAMWMCKLANVLGNPTVCSQAWSDTARSELWFRYHAPAAYRFGPDRAWHEFFGIPAGEIMIADWQNGSASNSSYASHFAPWNVSQFVPMAALQANAFSTKVGDTHLPIDICYSAFYRAYPGDDATVLANCNNGTNDVADALGAWLNSLYY